MSTIMILSIIFGVLLFVVLLYKQYKQGRKDMLNKLFHDNEISVSVYKKYMEE